MRVQLFDANWQPVSELVEATARAANVIRQNEGARFSFGVPGDSVNAASLSLASNVLIAERIPAHITNRDASGPVMQFEALGCDDLLNAMLTPRKWVYWNQGSEGFLDGDLATAVRDMLKRARMKRWTTLADFNGAVTKTNVAVQNLSDMGDSVTLATEAYLSAQRYVASGSIVLRYQLPTAALSTGKLVRWTEHVGDENRIRVRTRTAATEAGLASASWGAWQEAVHAEEIEENETKGVIALDGGPWIEIELELTTQDQKTPDDEEEPTIYGTTPVLAGVELIWREAGPIAEGSIPASTGIIVTDTEYNRMSHLKALQELCAKYKYAYRIRLDNGQLVLDLAQSFGTDKSDSVIFRHGDNAAIQTLRENDADLANVLHCWGAGSGAEQLYVELRDEASIALYGERHADFEDTDITDIATLIAKGQEELDKRKDPAQEFAVQTSLEQLGDAWLQDTVTAIDPRSGAVVALPVEEIRITDDPQQGETVWLGLGTRLSLGQTIDLVDEIVRGRAKPTGIKSQPSLAAPILRATGLHKAIRLSWSMVANAAGYDIEHSTDGGATWSLLRSGVPALQFEHTDLVLGSQHQYRVYAKSGSVRSNASNVASAVAKDTTPPAAPTGLTVEPGPGKVVRLKWTPPADDDVAEYQIWRKTGNSPSDPSGATLIAEEAGNIHLDTTGDYGATYTWFVKAVDRDENVSGFSNGVSGTVPATSPNTSTPDSLAGIGLAFGADSLYQDATGNWFVRVTINLTGIPADSKRAFIQIKHRKSGSATYHLDDQVAVASGSVSVGVDDLLPNVEYEFAAVPVSHFGIEGTAKTGSKTTAKDSGKPPQPTGVTANGILRGVRVYVPRPSQAAVPDYKLTRVRIKATAGGAAILTIEGDQSEFEVTSGLTAGTTYYADAQYEDTSGNVSELWSAEKSAVAGKVNPGDLDRFTDDGRTGISGNAMVTTDSSGLERLVVGNVGGQMYAGNNLPPATYGLWGREAGIFLQGYTKVIAAGQVTMPGGLNADGSYGVVIPLGGSYPRDSIVVQVGQVNGGMIPVMTYEDKLVLVEDGYGVDYYEVVGDVEGKGYSRFSKTSPIINLWTIHAAEANYVGFRPNTSTISEVLISSVMMLLTGDDLGAVKTVFSLGAYGIPDASYVVLLKG